MIHVSGTLPSDQRPTLIDCSPAVAVDESPAVVSSIALRFSFRQQIHRLVDWNRYIWQFFVWQS